MGFMCGKERSKENGWEVSLHVIHKWLPFCMVSEKGTCLVGEWVPICQFMWFSWSWINAEIERGEKERL